MDASAKFGSYFGEAHIRIATPEDIEALVRVINAAFVVEQIAIEGDRVDRDKVVTFMRTGTFLLLEDGPATLGCVYVEKRGDRGYLGLLSVDPALQKKGLGRRLTAAAEKHLQEQGCNAVDLRVISPRAELLTFYGKLGYVVTGTSPMAAGVPLKVPCHYIHMTKSLL
jgi:predicted N-acetyltransferase YhbS